MVCSPLSDLRITDAVLHNCCTKITFLILFAINEDANHLRSLGDTFVTEVKKYRQAHEACQRDCKKLYKQIQQKKTFWQINKEQMPFRISDHRGREIQSDRLYIYT